jgi:GAF domain-containing protein
MAMVDTYGCQQNEADSEQIRGMLLRSGYALTEEEDEADVIVARAFADLATLTIVQHRAGAEVQRLNEQLSAALTSRVVIEQAKGVISERTGLHLDQAFARLRAYARSHNLRLTDVAQAAIDGTLDPLAWASSAQT